MPDAPVTLTQIVAARDREVLAMRLHDAFFATEGSGLMGYPLWLAMTDGLLADTDLSNFTVTDLTREGEQ